MLSYILSKVSCRSKLHITGNATLNIPLIFAASTMNFFLTDANRIKAIYRIFRRISDNADCNSDGFSGSLTPESLLKVLNAGDVFGSRFLDIGAGVGRPLAAAYSLGASSVHGFELPKNKSHRYIFDASMKEISQSLFHNPFNLNFSRLEFEDIEKVLSCPFHGLILSDSIFEMNRCLRCRSKPVSSLHSGLECIS